MIGMRLPAGLLFLLAVTEDEEKEASLGGEVRNGHKKQGC